MNPILRRIIVQLLEKSGRAAYQAYVNVNKRHGRSQSNLFEQFRAQLKNNPSARMTVEEATRILSIEPHLRDSPSRLESVG